MAYSWPKTNALRPSRAWQLRIPQSSASAQSGLICIGAQLVAAPLLEQKYRDGREATPAGWALVQAAIDWRRVGIYQPIRESSLQELYRDYLPGYLDPDDQLYRDGLTWAREPVASEVALLMLAERHPEPSFIPFDYIVAYADGEGGGHAFEDIPPQTWNFAVMKADPQGLSQVGTAAAVRGHNEAAIAAFTRAAGSNELTEEEAGSAAFYAGILLQDADPAQVEQYWRIAADAGNPLAALVLGSQLQSHDATLAVHYLRKAADAELGDAALQLGILLRDRDPALAEHYLMMAADTGDVEDDVSNAFLQLSLLVHDRDPALAEQYLRKAADKAADFTLQFSSFSDLIQDRDPAQVEHDLRTAADASGDNAADAALQLGILLRDRDPALAEQYLRKAADADNDGLLFAAALQLGILLRDRDPALAEQYLRKAADDAAPAAGSMKVSIDWYARDRDSNRDKQFLREAADGGDPGAALELSRLLRDEDPVQSEHYLRRAANEGDDPMAFLGLGLLLSDQDDEDEAEHWYWRAANAGLPIGQCRLGLAGK
jgi:TPR repeat protein